MDSLDWDAEKEDADTEEENTDAELGVMLKERLKTATSGWWSERFEPDPPRETEEKEGTNCSLHRKWSTQDVAEPSSRI